ncbi:MAG TPA: AbrB/MazE/SpoVT family DNA-binding domain-containing protein [Candidatus Aenigmarchaeota archaeon]|nr:AbrB/MazE/SpoVT family DNA-binding domain-containing protein [Candidatus Aenigmarchaeota archaeon]
MPAVAKILSRGRMTIPKEIRKYLGLKAGEKLVFIKSQNELVIRRKYDSKT